MLLPLFQEAGEVQVHAAVGEAPHVGETVPRPGYVRLVVAAAPPSWPRCRAGWARSGRRRRSPSAPTRPMAPPWNQTSIVEWSDGAASACSMRRSITSSPRPSHVQRLPVVAPPVRVVLVQDRLRLGVGHRSAEVHDRLAELAQGPSTPRPPRRRRRTSPGTRRTARRATPPGTPRPRGPGRGRSGGSPRREPAPRTRSSKRSTSLARSPG